MYLTSIIY